MPTRPDEALLFSPPATNLRTNELLKQLIKLRFPSSKPNLSPTQLAI